MRIHPLSDLHLESGPYGLAPGIDCDVIVAAGDIAEGAHGVEFLKTLPRPVVYVLGNHEYWDPAGTVDMEDRLQQIRAAARASNVHVLERDAVVIDGVRFLGTTMWTNFGGGHRGLMECAHARMGDYRNICARKWYARRGNREKFLNFYRGKRHASVTEEVIHKGLLDPYIVYQLHCQAVDWLKGQLLEHFDGETVVITHHHPSFQSLRKTGVAELYLTPSDLWNRSREDNLIPVAAYASDLWEFKGHRGSHIALWVCAHLHSRLDYMEGGMRIVCNPRGQAIHPYTEREKRVYALQGYAVTQKDEESLAARLAEDPYMGYGHGFDRNWVIDLDSGLSEVIAAEAEGLREDLTQLRAEIGDFAPMLLEQKIADPLLIMAVREAIEQRTAKFAAAFDALCKHVYENVDGELWSHIPHNVVRRLGLPLGAGAIQFRATPFAFPGDPPASPSDAVVAVLDATAAGIECLDLLPQAVQTLRAGLLRRMLLVMERLDAAGIKARYEPGKGVLRPWRRLRFDLGSVLLDPTCVEMKSQANEICEQVVNPDWPRVHRDFSVSIVTVDEKYLDEPFEIIYARSLTLEQLRKRLD